MLARQAFERALNVAERRMMAALTSPDRIQAFIDRIPYSADGFYRCPLRLLREHTGHCFDGALFAAAALHCIGYPAIILELVPSDRDDDHIVALFKRHGHWGAVAKSNFAGLRYREPIHRSLRELVLSYFEQYYNIAREKTLRGYTRPLNLKSFDKTLWMTRDEPLERIAARLDEMGKVQIVSGEMIAELAMVDERSSRAGLFGANQDGLYRPPKSQSG